MRFSFWSSSSKVELAPQDELARRIQHAVERLEADGEISPERWGGPPPRFNGYCARSCRAYYLLAQNWPEARAISEYADATIRRSPGDSDEAHFWLQLPDGRVLDLNYAPHDKPGRSSRYRNSESGMSFHRDKRDSRYPARRDAQKIMRMVLEDLGAKAE